VTSASSGLYSAASLSLGIASPRNIFTPSTLSSLVAQARRTQNATAVAFSNGNANLAKGINVQFSLALDLYQQDKASPLELNLSMFTFALDDSSRPDSVCQHLVTPDPPRSRTGLADHIPASTTFFMHPSPEVERTSLQMTLPHSRRSTLHTGLIR
jgi:hypothetical protein